MIRFLGLAALCYCFGNGWTSTQILSTNGGFQQAPCRWVDPIVAECQGVRNLTRLQTFVAPEELRRKSRSLTALSFTHRDDLGSWKFAQNF